MIRQSSLFCKLIKTKISSEAIFSSFMKDFSPVLKVCPFCGSKNTCFPFASYERHLVDFIGEHSQDYLIHVSRLQCSSCHHTHAILPDVIVPYASYSLFFILRVIAEYFLHLSSVQSLCSRFQISHSMLYKWLHLFYQHKSLWLGILADAEISSLSFLFSLCSLDSFSLFSRNFFFKYDISFLQAHAHSPTFYQQY